MAEGGSLTMPAGASSGVSWLRRLNHGGRVLLDRMSTRSAVVSEVFQAVSRYGFEVARRTGVPIAAQLLHAVALRTRYRISADAYYLLGLYDEERRRRAPLFVDDATVNGFLSELAERQPGGSFEVLDDKRAFEAHCRRHGLPAVPALAYLGVEGVSPLRASDLPAADLFSKPTRSWMGFGAIHWTYVGQGRYQRGHGPACTRRELVQTLAAQAEDEPVVLQRFLVDAAPLRVRTARSGPSTLRIVTICAPEGEPEFFASFITLPLRESAAPTFSHRKAMAAAVSQDGRLGRLYFKEASFLFEGSAYHPQSLERMTGWKLPFWEEARELALRAHATLPQAPCVGWDLVLTDEGPRLLEANNDCSAELVQITHREMLGGTRLTRYLDAYARDLVDEE